MRFLDCRLDRSPDAKPVLIQPQNIFFFFFFTHLFEAVDAVPVQPELQPTAGFRQRVRLAPGGGCWSGGGCPAHPRGFHAVPAPHPQRRPHQRVGARAEKPRRPASQQQRASQTTSAPSQRAQRILYKLGLLEKGFIWRARRAIYVLRKSLRQWELERNGDLDITRWCDIGAVFRTINTDR